MFFMNMRTNQKIKKATRDEQTLLKIIKSIEFYYRQSMINILIISALKRGRIKNYLVFKCQLRTMTL